MSRNKPEVISEKIDVLLLTLSYAHQQQAVNNLFGVVTQIEPNSKRRFGPFSNF
ncbi:hypothetical protein Pla110_32570 [Polystyrenella longa]|uniref:Uncharacterized protein n=1 Tax=Polystyrenella longa TaxID=2528007 RepID=A0A518CQM4_9PLAN|nr:hypothetical protein Pla110_32570 [Polystyrenella longa]